MIVTMATTLDRGHLSKMDTMRAQSQGLRVNDGVPERPHIINAKSVPEMLVAPRLREIV
jgi:hypothetical protein